MKRRMKTIGIIFGAALMMAATAYASEAEHPEKMAGAYETYTEQGLTDEAREAFEKAMKNYKTDEKLTPVQLLETQVVAGINYRILCDKEWDGLDGRAVITVYQDLDGNCEVTNEQNVISPFRYKEAMNNKDFGGSIAFEASDFDWDNKTLTFDRYTPASYHAGEISSMKEGDLIEVSGRIVTVNSIEESETTRRNFEGKEERAAVIEINKGTADEQRFVADEGGRWIAPIENDHNIMIKIGSKTLPFTEKLKFTDCTDEPGEKVEVPYEELQSYMQKKIENNDLGYGPYNTTIEVENNTIVSITRTWMP